MLQPFSNKKGIGLVYSNALLTDSELEPTGYTLFEKRKHFALDQTRSAAKLVKHVGINGCTMAFRSSLKGLVLPIGKEWGHDHWIAFVAHAVTDVKPISQPLMFYRRHDNSAGCAPQLDRGIVATWNAKIESVPAGQFERDVHHWKVMHQRLFEIEARGPASTINSTKLSVYLNECEQRLELACLRRTMKSKRRLNRLPAILYIFFSGYYHRYLQGIKSLGKDLFIQ